MRFGWGMLRGLGVVVMAAAVWVSASGCGGPTAAASSPVGTWKVTYGAPGLVKIEATASDEYLMTAASPITVVGAACELPIGTTIAKLVASGGAYTGQHGLWGASGCAFVQYTTVSLTVNGDDAVEQLGNGETHTLTRVTSSTTHSGYVASWWWLWLLLVAVVLGFTAWLLWWRRRRRLA